MRIEPDLRTQTIPQSQAAAAGMNIDLTGSSAEEFTVVLHARDMVCISSIDWDFLWQGHQEIMSRLADAGNRVLFIENTGVRRPGLKDLRRLRHRLRNWRRGTKGFREERPNLFVYSPVILPFPYSRPAQAVNRSVMMRPIRRWMRAADWHRPIVWAFLPTPFTQALIREVDPILTIYYCIDDFASSSPSARHVQRSEDQLLASADLVFVTSEKLRARAALLNQNVHVFPFAVNYDAFEHVRTGTDPLPPDLERVPRPVVGYVGGLHQWVDQDLLLDAPSRLPNVSFVLVGPAQADVSKLEGRPNIHLLGAKAHAELARYVKGFDVGLVPYRLTEYTANVYPTKLNEYLAMGLPVVSTDLPEIRRFNADHGDVVQVAGNWAGFADAIQRSIEGSRAETVQRRLRVARTNGWGGRVARMTALIQAKLADREGSAPDWATRLRGMYRSARRVVWASVTAAALLVLFFYTPFLWAIASPLQATAVPSPGDAIVVFGGGVGESGQAGGGYQERVGAAVDAYRRGLAPTVIFSSGFVFTFREAEVMRDVAVANGVPDAAIVLELGARSTLENVANVNRILESHRWRRVLLVSSPYHMKRALLTWKKQAPDVTVVPMPVAATQFYRHDSGASFDQIRGIAHEYIAILYYWWNGYI